MILLGLGLLAAGALALLPLENWIHRHLSGSADWLAEHLYLPVARLLLVIGFLYAVYPAPLLTAAVVTGTEPDWPQWRHINALLFFAGLALPLLPTMQRFAALILPVQALLGAWVFVAAFETSTGQDLSLANPAHAIAGFALLMLGSHFLLHWAGGWLAQRRGWDALSCYDALALIIQPPLVLLVTRQLLAT